PVGGAAGAIGLQSGAPAGRIVVQVTSDGTTGLASVACTLTIAGTDTVLTTDANGWITSNSTAAGAVTLRIRDKLVQLAAATTPTPTLTLTPASPTRGDTGKLEITAPASAVHFKVTDWTFVISHSNPGDTTPSTATVTRPARESAQTFDQSWEGMLCASGKAKVKWLAGVTLRGVGDSPISTKVTATDPAEVTLDVNVAARSGTMWQTALVEKPEEGLVKGIATFHDTGEHLWDPTVSNSQVHNALPAGPNRGCRFVKSLNVTFTSTPKINSLLRAGTSAFKDAQDKAYLTSVTLQPPDPKFRHTIRPIPRQ